MYNLKQKLTKILVNISINGYLVIMQKKNVNTVPLQEINT